MTPATAAPDTLADVLEQLGDIPPHRILWRPFPGTATEADQLRYVDREPKRLVELIDGILVEKAMGQREALLAATLIHLLMCYVRPRRLGIVAAPDAIIRVAAEQNRLPDVCYTAWENLPSDSAHLTPVADYAPDLVVEILSEGNTRKEMQRKRREYIAAGTSLVWIFDPDDRTVAVYTEPDTPDVVLSASDTLSGGDVLPGFTLPLSELFDDPQLNPRT
jgi:Uma2 family endonuclease